MLNYDVFGEMNITLDVRIDQRHRCDLQSVDRRPRSRERPGDWTVSATRRSVRHELKWPAAARRRMVADVGVQRRPTARLSRHLAGGDDDGCARLSDRLAAAAAAAEATQVDCCRSLTNRRHAVAILLNIATLHATYLLRKKQVIKEF